MYRTLADLEKRVKELNTKKFLKVPIRDANNQLNKTSKNYLVFENIETVYMAKSKMIQKVLSLFAVQEMVKRVAKN